ncbi:MAG: hypothetical protein ISS70_26635 [Phycisphaerae bacterium]|nr:hypothetical protein [Phycisphaerae bacterium]
MDRFLLALIFLRRAKRKLVRHVDLMTLAVDRCVDRTNRHPVRQAQGKALELIREKNRLDRGPNWGGWRRFPICTIWSNLQGIVRFEIPLWYHRTQILSFPLEKMRDKRESTLCFVLDDDNSLFRPFATH